MDQVIARNRNPQIETLRGFAVLLLVVGHVIGSTPEGGMKIPFPSFWRYLYLYIDYLQMPLFTAIAGWVYGFKPYSQQPFVSFVKDKFIRLLVPMAVVGTLYFVIQYLTPGTNAKGDFSQIWRIYVFPYTLYWYLPSLFLIFLIQFGLDRSGLLRHVKGYLFAFVLAYVVASVLRLEIIQTLPNLFSFKGALLLFPYFLFGVMSSRLKEWIEKPLFLYFGIASLLLSLGMIQWNYFALDSFPEIINNCISPLLTCGVLALLFRLKWNNSFLVWLGLFSYGIYLFHGFGTAGGRIILSYLHVQNEILVFLFASSVALLGSILCTWLLTKQRWLALLFLGIRKK